jgi:hypothetical protein
MTKGKFVAYLIGLTYGAMIFALVVGLVVQSINGTIKRVEMPASRVSLESPVEVVAQALPVGLAT